MSNLSVAIYYLIIINCFKMKKNLNIKIDEGEDSKESIRSPVKTGRTTARNLALNLNAMPGTSSNRYYQQKTLSL